MKWVILAIVLSLGIASQAESKAQYQIQIRPIDGQVENWQNGIQYVDDIKSESTVRIVGSQDILPDKQSTFRVFVLNKSDKPIIFGPENISIEYSDDAIIQMDTYEDLISKLRRDIKRRQTLSILGQAFSTQAANGHTTGSFDYSGTTAYGGHVSGSGTYSGYDAALARQQQQAVQEQSAAVNRAIQARQLNGSQALDSLIRRTTVQPGASTGGVVAYEAPSSFKRLTDSALITIVVAVGGEEHKITATISQIR